MRLEDFDEAVSGYWLATQMPPGDKRIGSMYRTLWTIVLMSKKMLPEGVELGDLSWLYQQVMEEFDFLECCDDLSVKENATLKGIKTQGWDNLDFRPR